MSLTASELRVLFERLRTEGELAPGAALAADAAGQYDRTMARLLDCGEPAVVAEALALLHDETRVRGAEPPHDPVEGGYGRHFGAVTVGDKARFLLERVLGEAQAAEAMAEGPGWLDGRTLRWRPERQQFG